MRKDAELNNLLLEPLNYVYTILKVNLFFDKISIYSYIYEKPQGKQNHNHYTMLAAGLFATCMYTKCYDRHSHNRTAGTTATVMRKIIASQVLLIIIIMTVISNIRVEKSYLT